MRTDASEHKLLRKLIMATTKKHIAEKADVFEIYQHEAAMEEMHDEEDPKDLVDKVASHMSHFGLHRRSEPMQIEMEDVALDKTDDADVNFPRPTKMHAEGFSRKMSGCAKPIFRKHIAQLSQKEDKNLGF